MKKWVVKLAEAVLRRYGTHNEPPGPQPPPEQSAVHQIGGQTGVIGNHTHVEGDIIFYGKGDENEAVAEHLDVYRRQLLKSLQRLSLRGLDTESSDAAGQQRYLELDQVYVDLDTQTQVTLTDGELQEQERKEEYVWRETRPLSALEAAVRHRRLVILGAPGSGKSTFLNHLALRLLMNGSAPQTCDALACWPSEETDLLPVHVVLRDFAAWLAADKADPKAEADTLWRFIAHRLERQKLEGAVNAIKAGLEAGRAILLLDGLDEIPGRQQRAFVRDAVAAFADRYDQCRCIVTCRTLSYQDPKSRLDDAEYPDVQLAPLGRPKIDTFIQAWFADLRRLEVLKTDEEVADQIQGLKAAVRREDLSRLAPNPLLLTVMALVHTHKGRLPDARAKLYEEAVEILLWRWEQVKRSGKEAAILTEQPNETDNR